MHRRRIEVKSAPAEPKIDENFMFQAAPPQRSFVFDPDSYVRFSIVRSCLNVMPVTRGRSIERSSTNTAYFQSGEECQSEWRRRGERIDSRRIRREVGNRCGGLAGRPGGGGGGQRKRRECSGALDLRALGYWAIGTSGPGSPQCSMGAVPVWQSGELWAINLAGRCM